jgi:hypothetical protein
VVLLRHTERNAAELREVEVHEQCRALLIWMSLRHTERNAAELREVEVHEQCRALLIWNEI